MPPSIVRGLLLLSGGIDSPVAGHTVASHGYPVSSLHFSLEPFTDDSPEGKSRLIARALGFPFMVCRAGNLLESIARHCAHRYYFVLSKRFMLRIAEAHARNIGCDFLVTGENMGQVSSQTLENLAVIDRAVSMPVLRPLIGHDKQEIVDRARGIGTYEVSCGPEVCDVLGPRHPATASRLEVIESEEARLDMGCLVRDAVSTIGAG
jgi:thiamine biosynthesis protein ThiI